MDLYIKKKYLIFDIKVKEIIWKCDSKVRDITFLLWMVYEMGLCIHVYTYLIYS
jgi:hypothetical protein